jgi:Ca2+-binding EF-hand superfamily protein
MSSYFAASLTSVLTVVSFVLYAAADRLIDHFAVMDVDRTGLISLDAFFTYLKWPRTRFRYLN